MFSSSSSAKCRLSLSFVYLYAPVDERLSNCRECNSCVVDGQRHNTTVTDFGVGLLSLVCATKRLVVHFELRVLLVITVLKFSVKHVVSF